MEKIKIFATAAIFCLALLTFISITPVSEDNQVIERNYEGEYYLGLIPNSPELPPTISDEVLGQSETKEMIKSPFGYVYLRDR